MQERLCFNLKGTTVPRSRFGLNMNLPGSSKTSAVLWGLSTGGSRVISHALRILSNLKAMKPELGVVRSMAAPKDKAGARSMLIVADERSGFPAAFLLTILQNFEPYT